MKFLAKTRWIVLDCLTGVSKLIEKVPFSIGSDAWADFRLEGESVFARHCEITYNREQGYYIAKIDPEARLVINGMADVDFAPLKPVEDYSLTVSHHLLLIRGDKDVAGWQRRLQTDGWTLRQPDLGPLDDTPRPILEICGRALSEGLDRSCFVVPAGATMGFRLNQVLEIFTDQLTQLPAPSPPQVSQPSDDKALDVAPRQSSPRADPTPSFGLPILPDGPFRFRCPTCLLRFNEQHVLHIAVHASVRGVRFRATRFNELHQALDVCGEACADMACPHCNSVLFPGFLHLDQHILSIIGDPSAGKSYYLSVMVRILRDSLHRQFSAVLQEADPAGNAMLTDMVRTLFSAQTPEDAHLVKTVLDGQMYVEVQRHGSPVRMPRPFVFSLESHACQPVRRDHHSFLISKHQCALVFYDNAGEHYLPGQNSVESPGAQHIASASGILFLFDPFNSLNFRRHITELGTRDPQLSRQISDQQEIILSETRSRLIKLLNLKPGEKTRTPLGILVGKYDAWAPLVQHRPFRLPANVAGLDADTIQYNSTRLRELMLELAPGIVANAESLSSQVTYFPVSSFGHTPVNTREGYCAPDPLRLVPIMVDIPPLWILSEIEPKLVPKAPFSTKAPTPTTLD